MNKKTKSRIITALCIIWGLTILIPLWTWALFGISKNVGTAWFVTGMVVACALLSFWEEL